MKYIIAVIKPHKLEELRNSLSALGVSGMTVSEVKGYGRQKGHSEVYRGTEYQVDFLPKLKIEIAVSQELVNPVVEAIQTTVKTSKIGDGKVFVLDLEDVIRIRTGETGDMAL